MVVIEDDDEEKCNLYSAATAAHIHFHIEEIKGVIDKRQRT